MDNIKKEKEENVFKCLNNFKEKRKKFGIAANGESLKEVDNSYKELNSASLSLSYAVLACEDDKININFNKTLDYNIKIKVNDIKEYKEKMKTINQGSPARTKKYPCGNGPWIICFSANPHGDTDFVNIVYMSEFR